MLIKELRPLLDFKNIEVQAGMSEACIYVTTAPGALIFHAITNDHKQLTHAAEYSGTVGTYGTAIMPARNLKHLIKTLQKDKMIEFWLDDCKGIHIAQGTFKYSTAGNYAPSPIDRLNKLFSHKNVKLKGIYSDGITIELKYGWKCRDGKIYAGNNQDQTERITKKLNAALARIRQYLPEDLKPAPPGEVLIKL